MIGQCHICGISAELTNEHVPPRKAFNFQKSKLYPGDEVLKVITSKAFPWDFTERKGVTKQNGVGFRTLCSPCNNNTGGWYGAAFADFTLQGLKPVFSTDSGSKVKLSFSKIYPLRVLKQTLACFASIAGPKMFQKNSSLKDFVLNKESKNLSDDYWIYFFGCKGPNSRYLGITSLIKDIRSTDPDNIIVFSELCTMPFGFVLEFGAKPTNTTLVNITSFKDYNYDQSVDLEIEIPAMECNTYTPLDYRTREDIQKAAEAQRKNEK